VVAISGRARDDRTIEWVRAHLDLLRIGDVAVAVLLLLVLSVSWFGLLIRRRPAGRLRVWLHRIGRSRPTPALPTALQGLTHSTRQRNE
jgi:hypothetical protein